MDEEQKNGTLEQSTEDQKQIIRDTGSRAWGKGVILVVFLLGAHRGSKCQNSERNES